MILCSHNKFQSGNSRGLRFPYYCTTLRNEITASFFSRYESNYGSNRLGGAAGSDNGRFGAGGSMMMGSSGGAGSMMGSGAGGGTDIFKTGDKDLMRKQIEMQQEANRIEKLKVRESTLLSVPTIFRSGASELALSFINSLTRSHYFSK